jgi:hypothetical protein
VKRKAKAPDVKPTCGAPAQLTGVFSGHGNLLFVAANAASVGGVQDGDAEIEGGEAGGTVHRENGRVGGASVMYRGVGWSEEVVDLHVGPFFLEVFGHQAAVAMIGCFLAAEEAGTIELRGVQFFFYFSRAD